MIFSGVERLGPGGGSERRRVGFHALECLGGVEGAEREAVRWKIDKGATLGIQKKRKDFSSFQPGERVGGALGVPSTNESHCAASCSLRT